MGALPLIPRESRPQGLITWAAEAFALSRTSVYALGQRIQERLLTSAVSTQPKSPALAAPEPVVQDDGMFIEVTAERLQRTILAATFPGNVSIRPTQILL